MGRWNEGSWDAPGKLWADPGRHERCTAISGRDTHKAMQNRKDRRSALCTLKAYFQYQIH